MFENYVAKPKWLYNHPPTVANVIGFSNIDFGNTNGQLFKQLLYWRYYKTNYFATLVLQML